MGLFIDTLVPVLAVVDVQQQLTWKKTKPVNCNKNTIILCFVIHENIILFKLIFITILENNKKKELVFSSC